MKRFLLPAVLAVTAVVVFATAMPGIFTIDEDSYIATIVGLRDGSFRVRHTAGLPPSPELLSFDAAPMVRQVGETPVAPNTPPLYAVFALPFALFGIHGLIALQTLAFVACAWLVFAVVRRETKRTDLAWFALGVQVLCGFAIEYAQAIWPHALTMALVMAAVDLISRIRHHAGGGRRVVIYALLAGLAVAFAAGMRYQNIAIVGTAGIALLWVPQRKLAIAGYVLGAAIPLFASAAINASRLGSWNPISKGASYLNVGRARTKGEAIEQAFTSTWARVVDFTAWPAPEPSKTGLAAIMPKSQSGAFLILTGIKKSLLQSAPWIVLALAALAAAWRRRKTDTTNLLRGCSVVVAGVVGMFALYGFRDDGWCFNQRYLLELVPIFVVAAAIALVDWKPRWRTLAIGFGAGIVLAGVIVSQGGTLGGQVALMKLPVFIAAVIAVTWFVRERFAAAATAFAATLGLALGWAATVHVADDIPAGHLLRAHNRHRLSLFEQAVPDDGKPIAIVAYWGTKDTYGPLLLSRDVVIIDPWIDQGRDAVMLLDALLRAGRIVYIDRVMPMEILVALTKNRRVEGGSLPWLIRIQP